MQTKRTRIIVGVVAILIVVAIALLLSRCDGSQTVERPRKRDTSQVAERPGASSETTPGVTPSVVDTPSNPATANASSNAGDDGDDGGGESGGSPSKPRKPSAPSGPGEASGPTAAQLAYRKYLADTKYIVTTNSRALKDTVAGSLSDIATNDSSKLLLTFAPDESALWSDANRLTGAYPQILESQISPTVNVYSVGSATVYFGFAVVEWQDGGVLSKHTIGVPLRFIDGQWYLSTIDLNTPGLTYVQSVQI